MSNKRDQPKKIFRNRPASEPEKSQADKFREAAREHETDDSEENFDRVLKRLVKTPPPKGDDTNRNKSKP